MVDEAVELPAAYAGYLVRFRTRDVLTARWTFLYSKTNQFQEFISTVVISSTIDNVNGQKYANMSLPLPPLDEQRAIADFLDAMDAKITRFIADRRRIIALLEEQKQAIINQAVTRGLDLGVPLKPSGIDWLGDIPTHWEEVPIRSVFFERKETNEDLAENRVLSVMSKIGVIPYEEKGNIGNKASEDISRYKIVRRNDLVLNSMNVIIGSVGISRYDGCLSPVYYVLRQNPNRVTIRYAELLFENEPFQKSLVRIGNGILVHRMRIPIEKLRAESIPLPPLDDQHAIANFVDAETDQIAQVMTRARREIELMLEYRTRLISDVVTGKLDVQGIDLPSQEEPIGMSVDLNVSDNDIREEVIGANPA